MELINNVDNILEIFNYAYTAWLFVTACCCVTGLFCLYLLLQLLRDSWISFLEKRFPDLEFDRSDCLRTVLDSQRNVGVVVALLTARGQCNPALLTRRLMEEVVDKKLTNGQLAFHRLRMTLTSRWGRYAWMKRPFSLDNHVTLCQPIYRGRPVSEVNIQEYVNELVVKYLSNDIPPWHLSIIPTCEDRYYLVLRVHHLLLSDQSGMQLNDFFPILAERQHFRSSAATRWGTPVRPHLLRNLYKYPRAIPSRLDQLSQQFSNQWNEFLATYDPVENPAAWKNPGIKSAAAVLLIGFVATIKTAMSTFCWSKQELKRRISIQLLCYCFWNSSGPLIIADQVVRTLFWIIKLCVIKMPLTCACEFWAMCKIHDEQYADRSVIKAMLNGWEGMQACWREVTYLFCLIYDAPRIILEEIFFKRSSTPHYLQTVPHRGRKVVSWSQPVSIELIEAIEEATGASRCDILLTATAAALKDFFLLHDQSVPDVIHATTQAITQEELLTRRRQAGDRCARGIVCLAIPTKTAWDGEDGDIAELHTMQQIVLRTRIRQPALYLATALELQYNIFTKCLPSHLLRLIINALSRRFSISIIDVYQPSNVARKHLLWGHDVEALMYWSPPQSNVCLSLTLMSYGNNITLGVMADSQLSPYHNIISSTFTEHVRRLATATGVVADTRTVQISSDESDESGENQSPNSFTSSSVFSFDDDTVQQHVFNIDGI